MLKGWQLKSRNMTTMAIVALGVALIRSVLKLMEPTLPKAFQVYALGDIKIGFLAYNVFISLSIRCSRNHIFAAGSPDGHRISG